MLPEDILGKIVISANGEHLGHVDDLDIDVNQRRVAALRIKLQSDVIDQLNLKDFVHKDRINIPTAEISSLGDTVVLRLGKNDLRNIVESGRAITLSTS